MEKLVGRRREQEYLLDAYDSGRPELVAVYGRRRVGKTFLVRQVFDKEFAFQVTAVLDEDEAHQLAAFASALAEYRMGDEPELPDWFAAFRELRALLEQANRKRKVVFIDEMPWLDTPGSDFLAAFEHFWNSWGSAQSDLMLIVCGSAASWMVKKLFQSRGGLHNRVTRRLLIQPFTLGEARELAAANGLPVDTASVVESYMVLGGIPYYLSLLSPKLSLAQNIGRLCFEAGGVLRNEFENLYLSLFKGAERHLLVVRALGRRLAGLTREEIIQAAKLPQSGSLSSVLNELETSGFIRSYTPYGRKRKGTLYQLVDHFTLFHLAFIERSQTSDSSYWLKASQTQAYRTWRGYAFEQICLAHLDQIRQALGIQGVIADVSAWRSYEVDPGAQIDLVLDRADRVVSLCEMKYSESALTITKALSQSLRQKRDAFLEETGTRKGVQVVLITPEGVKRGSHDDAVSAVVTALDLMK